MMIHIDTAGMSEKEKTIAVLSEIVKHIEITQNKRKSKQIREDNRINEMERKKKKRHRKAHNRTVAEDR